jgi:hypothetical protein
MGIKNPRQILFFVFLLAAPPLYVYFREDLYTLQRSYFGLEKPPKTDKK